MSRPQVTLVRDARAEDLAALVTVWCEGGTGITPTDGFEDEAAQSLARLAESPDERLLVGVVDGRVVSMLSLRRCHLSPLHTGHVVHSSYLLVLPEFRRHGCAHALIEAAVQWAEELGVEHVTAITSSNSRDSNRFLARLGLSTIATVRVSATGALRAKVSPPPSRGVGRVLHQRRSMRRRGDAS